MNGPFRIAVVAIAGIGIATWAADYVALMKPLPAGKLQWETIRVDQVYATTNRFGQIEHSRGNPVMEVCGNSWLPHEGHRPCWYVKTHTMHTNHLE